MKIVLTIHHFPPNYSAGAEIYTFRLANWLVKHGQEVEVVCVESIEHEGRDELEYSRDLYENISVWRLRFNLRCAPDPFRYSFDNPLIGNWFRQFLGNTRPDIVHVNSCYLLSASTVKAVKELQLPLVMTLHDFWFTCPRITLLKPSGKVCTVPENPAECAWCLATERRRFRWAEMASRGAINTLTQSLIQSPLGARALGVYPDAAEILYRRKRLLEALNQSDVILAPSQFLRQVFVRQGIDPDKIIYSRLGLDTSHWVSPAEVAPRTSDEVRIGYIGQLSPHKGVHLLIRAFTHLNFSNRSARLKIYGNPDAFPAYSRSLQKLAGANTQVEFAGGFDNRRIAEILAETDVTVVPSIWYENSPITIMEALTAGTPVVTANLGGMPELVQDTVNGLLFKPGDSHDLARQLQRLLDEPELLPALAAGAQPVRMIDDEMAHLNGIYKNLLTSRQNVHRATETRINHA